MTWVPPKRKARFGTYDLIDFAAVLIGSILSGEPTGFSFYERLETDTKQAGSSFLREKSYVVAPPKGDKAGKETAHVQ
jgi:hypothetical protein